jgi:hypothetical protein
VQVLDFQQLFTALFLSKLSHTLIFRALQTSQAKLRTKLSTGAVHYQACQKRGMDGDSLGMKQA